MGGVPAPSPASPGRSRQPQPWAAPARPLEGSRWARRWERWTRQDSRENAARTLWSWPSLEGDREPGGREGTQGSRRSPSAPDTEGQGCGRLATAF